MTQNAPPGAQERPQTAAFTWERLLVVSLLSAVFFLALAPAASDVCLALAGLLWLGRLLRCRGACFCRAPFDRWIAALAAIAALSVLASPDRGFSFYNYYNLMGRYLLTYYLIVQNITTLRQTKLLFAALAAAAVCVVGYGFYQYIFGIDVTDMLWVDGEQFPELKTRVFSTLQNPNILAGYLVMLMLLIFGIFCKIRRGAARLALASLFVLMGVCLALTYCRGAWLSLLLVLGTYGAFKNRRLLLWLGLGVLAAGLLDPSLTQRLVSAFGAGDTSSSMRLGIWESTIAMIIDHPLLGVGWGAYWMAYPAYDFFIQNDAVKIVHAHNLYLNFAAEIGIIGCLAFLGMTARHLTLALASTRLRQSGFLNGLILGGALSLIAVLVNGLTDYVLFNIELSQLFWLICAIVVIACRRSLP